VWSRINRRSVRSKEEIRLFAAPHELVRGSQPFIGL
jgi:hypothetical protein